jgi:hypothetical protein
MSIKFISSNQKIAEFKTIVFPSSSQRWVNLVRDKEKKKDDLDLTIDEILKESEIKDSSYKLKDSVLDKNKDEITKLKEA